MNVLYGTFGAEAKSFFSHTIFDRGFNETPSYTNSMPLPVEKLHPFPIINSANDPATFTYLFIWVTLLITRIKQMLVRLFQKIWEAILKRPGWHFQPILYFNRTINAWIPPDKKILEIFGGDFPSHQALQRLMKELTNLKYRREGRNNNRIFAARLSWSPAAWFNSIRLNYLLTLHGSVTYIYKIKYCNDGYRMK